MDEQDAPAVLTSNAVTVLDVYGSVFYAGARTLGQQLPKVEDATNAVVVLRLRGHGDIGSTFLTVVSDYADKLRACGGALLLSGVDPKVKARLTAGGHLDELGVENIYTADHRIWHSTEDAMKAAEALLVKP